MPDLSTNPFNYDETEDNPVPEVWLSGKIVPTSGTYQQVGDKDNIHVLKKGDLFPRAENGRTTVFSRYISGAS